MPIPKPACARALCAAALLTAGALAPLGSAQAFVLPIFDAARNAQLFDKTQSMVREHADRIELLQQEFGIMADLTEFYVETVNNTFANSVIRQNQMRTDIQNTRARARHEPVEYACREVSYSVSVEDAACAMWDWLTGERDAVSEGASAGLMQGFAVATDAGRDVSGGSESADVDGGAGDEDEALGAASPQDFERSLSLVREARRASEQWRHHPNRGREADIAERYTVAEDPEAPSVIDAGLLFSSDAETLNLNGAALEAARDFAFLVAPPGEPRMDTRGSVVDRGALLDNASEALMRNAAHDTFLRLISQRRGSAERPSELMTYSMAGQDAFASDPLSDEDEHSVLRYLTDGSLSSPEEVRRTSALLMAQQVTMMVERYREAQQIEYLTAIRVARRLNGGGGEDFEDIIGLP